jgi:hypothetical protein
MIQLRSCWPPTRNVSVASPLCGGSCEREATVGGLIYLIGLIVVILFILSFLGLR